MPIRLLIGAGLLLVSGGLLSMTAIDASSGWTTLIPGFLLAGAGIGMINPPLASTAVGVVHHSRSGMASGINNTFRQVGIATGVAGLGAVFQHQIGVQTTAALGSGPIAHRLVSAPHFSQALVSGAVRPIAEKLPGPAHTALLHAYRVGFTERAHLDPADRLGHRAAGLDRRLRADPQPRLRRLVRARRRGRGAADRGGRRLMAKAGVPAELRRCYEQRTRGSEYRRSGFFVYGEPSPPAA